MRADKFELRGGDFEAPGNRPAFIVMGDQFIALMPGRKQKADDQRHFGLVVDDRSGAELTHVESPTPTSTRNRIERFRYSILHLCCLKTFY